MSILCSSVYLSVLAGLLFLPGWGGRPFPAPRRAAPPAGRGGAAVRELYQLHCVKCHGGDGTGSAARKRMPEIPDFTRASWQKRRSDARLLASILDGRGADMPAHRGKITRDQARR